MHAQQRPYIQARHSQQDWWDKIWKDKRGNVVIFQKPNILLIAWAVLTVISLFVPRGSTQENIWWISVAALGLWSLLELFRGVNYFRRALGAIVLLITVASMFGVGR